MSYLDLTTIKGKCSDGVVRDFEATEETIAKCSMISLMKVLKETESAKKIKGMPPEMLELTEKLNKSAAMILEYLHSDYEIRIAKERINL